MDEGFVIWITGLSGSGKTTLSKSLLLNLRKMRHKVVSLDGDNIRSLISQDLDYSIESRLEQIRRIQNLTKLLYDSGLIVLVSALYSNDKLLDENRSTFSNYFEIYLEASTEKLVERDSKGIYGSFVRGELENVVGMDIEWEMPKKSDLIFNNDIFQPCEIMVRQIIDKIGFDD